jgi:hypothetical protein
LNTGDLRTGLPTALAGLQYKVLGKLGKMEDDIKLVKSEGNIAAKCHIFSMKIREYTQNKIYDEK